MVKYTPRGRRPSPYEQHGAWRPFKPSVLSWNEGLCCLCSHLCSLEGLTISGLHRVRQKRKSSTFSAYIFAFFPQILMPFQGNVINVWCVIFLPSQLSPSWATCSPSFLQHYHNFLLFLDSLSASLVFTVVFIYSFVCSYMLHSHFLLRVLWQTWPPLLHLLPLNKATAKWL